MTAKTMRNLNRIIFINSANIPYADDIYLDGNVHFIGTQGVGKSTVLRSILFFTMQIHKSWESRLKNRAIRNIISPTPIRISSMK